MDNDLISRSALLADLREKGFLPAIVQRAIERAPAVDAVEVVRCRECKHFRRNPENDTYCGAVGGLSDPEEHDFCSYGYRKEGTD